MSNNINATKASLSKRIDYVKKFAISSGIVVNKVEDSEYQHFVKFVFEIKNEPIVFHFLMKNIVGSGWTDKPYIKRIQIPPLCVDGMATNQNKVYSCLLGNIAVNEKILFVCWNPFRFTGHKTNRSCYVYDQSLIDCITEKDGLYRTIDANKELIICDEYNFLNFIKLYIKRNKIDDYEL